MGGISELFMVAVIHHSAIPSRSGILQPAQERRLRLHLDGCAIERHAQHAERAPRRDGAVRAIISVQEAAVGAGRPNLPAKQAYKFKLEVLRLPATTATFLANMPLNPKPQVGLRGFRAAQHWWRSAPSQLPRSGAFLSEQKTTPVCLEALCWGTIFA